MAAGKSLNQLKKANNGNDLVTPAKLSGKNYERELAKPHGELVKLQLWVLAKRLKVVVVFDGRDSAGKGGVINAITEQVNPRLSRRRPPRPDRAREVADTRHLPAGGEIVIFNRSGYNRAGLERVMEFSTMDQVKRFSQADADD